MKQTISKSKFKWLFIVWPGVTEKILDVQHQIIYDLYMGVYNMHVNLQDEIYIGKEVLPKNCHAQAHTDRVDYYFIYHYFIQSVCIISYFYGLNIFPSLFKQKLWTCQHKLSRTCHGQTLNIVCHHKLTHKSMHIPSSLKQQTKACIWGYNMCFSI